MSEIVIRIPRDYWVAIAVAGITCCLFMAWGANRSEIRYVAELAKFNQIENEQYQKISKLEQENNFFKKAIEQLEKEKSGLLKEKTEITQKYDEAERENAAIKSVLTQRQKRKLAKLLK